MQLHYLSRTLHARGIVSAALCVAKERVPGDHNLSVGKARPLQYAVARLFALEGIIF